jgi:hypothetical protein
MEAAPRWRADAAPGTAELVRLIDATPVPIGARGGGMLCIAT